MLVVDRHALLAVDLLDLFDQVLLGLAHTLDLEQFLRVAWALDDGVAGSDFLAVDDFEAGLAQDEVDLFGSVVGHHGQLAAPTLVVADTHDARGPRQRRLALRGARLEQLHDAGQACGEVLAGDATGVEGPHRELGARLADGLGGDDADGLADLDRLARGQRHAVARRRHADGRVVGEGRQHAHAGHLWIVAQQLEFVFAHDRALGIDGAVRQGDVVGEGPAEESGLEVGPLVVGVWVHVLEPDTEDGAVGLERCVLADDQLLRHVDEATSQVAGVGGTEGGVDQALPGARRGDEVLEHRQALAEVRLDGARNEVATGVGHQAAHAGDLANLHLVPSSTRVDHHVDRVEDLGPQGLVHLLGHLGGRGIPDLDLLLVAFTVGDDALSELDLDLLGVTFVAIEDRLLLDRRLDVVDGDGQARPAGEPEAQVLHAVQAVGHDPLRVVAGEVVDQDAHRLLVDASVDVGELGG